MRDDVDLLWALVSGVLLLLMTVGIAAIIEGFTRRRSVATGAGRHIATMAGAVGGSFGAVLLRESVIEVAEFWGLLSSAVLLSMIVSGAIVERGTFVAHAAVGVVSGAIVVPGLAWAQSDGGVLASISVGDDVFADAAASTIFGAAGWMALVGIMIIGPRRGRLAADGHMRVVPGKSMPTAAIGALIVLATSAGLMSRPDVVWDDELPNAASLIALSASVGAVVAVGVGWQRLGASSTASLVHGVLAGVVATMGAPFDLTVARAIVLGAVGALLAMLAISFADRVKLDDPVGIIGSFGVAGVWGTLASKTTGTGVLAQLVGAAVVAAFAVVVAGLVFGVLRAVSLLRISPEVELVGLEN